MQVYHRQADTSAQSEGSVQTLARRRRLRRLGGAAVLQPVLAARAAAVRRQPARRRRLLPRLPRAVEARRRRRCRRRRRSAPTPSTSRCTRAGTGPPRSPAGRCWRRTRPASLAPLTTAQRTGFETRIDVPAGASAFAVRALDADGEVLATSDPVSAAVRPPNLLLLITDQQRQPRHWPDDPGWLRRADAQRHRARPHRDQLRATHFCNTAMCSPSRATLFTGRYPAEHGVELTLTAADLRPDPRNLPGGLRDDGRHRSRRREAPRGARSRAASRAARCSWGRSPATSPSCRPRCRTSPRCCARRGYHVAYKGKWHLTHPLGGDGPLLGGWSDRDAEPARARLRVRRLGAARRRREREGRELRRRQRRRRARAGTRSTRARSSAGSAARSCRSRSASSSRWSTPTTCSATPPSTSIGGYRPGRVPRPRRRAAADDRRGPARPSPRVHALMRTRDDRLPRPAAQPRRRSSTTSTSTPTCTGSSTRRSAGCSPRSAAPTTPARCARGR